VGFTTAKDGAMRVLVTGHLGYIGTVMMPRLHEAGHVVTGLDMDLYRECSFGEEPKKFPGVLKDLRDVTQADLAGFDAIIHLAGLSNDPLGDLNPEVTYDINFRASVRLAEFAKAAGIKRFIFSSSCSIYGATGDKTLDENARFNPITPYGHSKVLVEGEVAKLADDRFSPTFLRNATAYGVSPRHRFDLVLNNLVAWAMCTGCVHIKSDGTPWRPIIHIEDISRAFLAVLSAPRETIHNRAFNVGRSDENYQVRDLAEIVRGTVPNCSIKYAQGAGPDKRSYRVDFSSIARELPDFQPQWTARRGAQELYDSYRRVGLKVEDFEGPRYTRIEHIRGLQAMGQLDESMKWKVLHEVKPLQ
jgi:nucleoside-diphosphate-sugar epimerase